MKGKNIQIVAIMPQELEGPAWGGMASGPEPVLKSPDRSGIPLCLENPKIGGVDDAEIVGDRIAEDGPIFRYLLAQEFQGGSAEVVVGRAAAVVGHVLVH